MKPLKWQQSIQQFRFETIFHLNEVSNLSKMSIGHNFGIFSELSSKSNRVRAIAEISVKANYISKRCIYEQFNFLIDNRHFGLSILWRSNKTRLNLLIVLDLDRSPSFYLAIRFANLPRHFFRYGPLSIWCNMPQTWLNNEW